MRSLAKNVYYYVVYTFTLNFSSNQKYILYKSSYQPTTRCVWNNSLCSKASRIHTESQMCTLLYYLLHHSNVNGYEFGIDWWAGCAQFQRFFEIIISIFFYSSVLFRLRYSGILYKLKDIEYALAGFSFCFYFFAFNQQKKGQGQATRNLIFHYFSLLTNWKFTYGHTTYRLLTFSCRRRKKTHHVGYITFAIIEIGIVRMFCYSVWVIDMI